jgi:hypothetical protein
MINVLFGLLFIALGAALGLLLLKTVVMCLLFGTTPL